MKPEWRNRKHEDVIAQSNETISLAAWSVVYAVLSIALQGGAIVAALTDRLTLTVFLFVVSGVSLVISHHYGRKADEASPFL